ncbi:MAG: 1-acyl-sn-glycerol-3-phosphate acyltransferase [Clostridia bacterium]|nr:1-acyl-sn-glycerol-3-phosphate acyltransferase [Clostridia bacterium]
MRQSDKKAKRPRKWRPFYNFLHDFVKITGGPLTWLWLRPKIYRPYGTRTPKGAVLISANHRSFIDPLTVLVSFPFRRLHCLVTKDLYAKGPMGAFLERVHCIKVDKDNFTVSAFHDVVGRLQNGHAVVIFPEGEVNQTRKGEILAFKSGAVLMAHKAGAPILPVYIADHYKWYQRQRVVIGEPIDLTETLGKMPSMAALTAASDDLRARELALKDYFESLPIYKRLIRSKKQSAKLQGETQDE